MKTNINLLLIGLLVFGLVSSCRAEEIDWNKLVSAVITVESNGNPNAYNEKSGAIGLMQITPCVEKEYLKYRRIAWDCTPPFCEYCNSVNLYDPEVNKAVGTWYLKRIWNHYIPHYGLPQDLSMLCACYNFGIGNVSRGKRYPRETRNYIKKVTELYERR